MARGHDEDLLADYKKLPVADTDKVVTAEWRNLERAKNSINGKLATKKKRFADFTLHPATEADTKKYHDWVKMKTDLVEEITILEAKLEETKNKQKNVPKRMVISELPEAEQFKNIDNSKKNLLDAVKMIAYRAETAMGHLIAKECGSLAKARAPKITYGHSKDKRPDLKQFMTEFLCVERGIPMFGVVVLRLRDGRRRLLKPPRTKTAAYLRALGLSDAVYTDPKFSFKPVVIKKKE